MAETGFIGSSVGIFLAGSFGAGIDSGRGPAGAGLPQLPLPQLEQLEQQSSQHPRFFLLLHQLRMRARRPSRSQGVQQVRS